MEKPEVNSEAWDELTCRGAKPLPDFMYVVKAGTRKVEKVYWIN